ncbi:DUF2490 domain-containing protein [Hyunsoonleella pacifica]|uniref:DUF2490 domain-containing protein n=1 Tax=Hyunsoonleella pacifica TaxID=1080224 RepID=A0A4Q9FR58_9FLAO|nr:DUF2490 domain-containing protein [Hyunsoonleella pacifica]TBN15749.1 DUF2490 domain-containing protein [Hyunsoonleella pacifica]GGD22275.1 hypothetical protein GCM10011368_25480 [Hyunsoonleella pacifica]
MRCIKSLILSIGLYLVSTNLFAQNNFTGFGESVLAVNHKISQSYTVNFALETRYFIHRNNTFLLNYQQIDFAHFSTLNLNYNHSLSLGLEYRNRAVFNEGSNEFRTTEQYNYKTQKLGVRYGHRFRSEQRFFENETVFRQRYRFAVDFPLNGEKLDIGEAYLVSSSESLLSLSKFIKPEIDIRLSSQIGWQITEQLKLQTGLEYRLGAFNLEASHQVFLLTTGVLKI